VRAEVTRRQVLGSSSDGGKASSDEIRPQPPSFTGQTPPSPSSHVSLAPSKNSYRWSPNTAMRDPLPRILSSFSPTRDNDGRTTDSVTAYEATTGYTLALSMFFGCAFPSLPVLPLPLISLSVQTVKKSTPRPLLDPRLDHKFLPSASSRYYIHTFKLQVVPFKKPISHTP